MNQASPTSPGKPHAVRSRNWADCLRAWYCYCSWCTHISPFFFFQPIIPLLGPGGDWNIARLTAHCSQGQFQSYRTNSLTAAVPRRRKTPCRVQTAMARTSAANQPPRHGNRPRKTVRRYDCSTPCRRCGVLPVIAAAPPGTRSAPLRSGRRLDRMASMPTAHATAAEMQPRHGSRIAGGGLPAVSGSFVPARSGISGVAGRPSQRHP